MKGHAAISGGDDVNMCLEPLYEHNCATLRNPTVARGERGEGAAAADTYFPMHAS